MLLRSSSVLTVTHSVWVGLVVFNGTSSFVGYLMPNPLYIYIKYTWFGLVGFYDISTIVGYLMSNPLHTYILGIFVWFGWLSLHINPFWLFNAKSSLYISIKCICLVWSILRHINHCRLYKAKSSFFYIQLNGFKDFYSLPIICQHTAKWPQVLPNNNYNLTSVIFLHSLCW